MSSNPWSPLAHLRLLPICATLGTGRGFGPGWQPASTTRTAIAAMRLMGDGSGVGIRRHIVRDPGTRIDECVVSDISKRRLAGKLLRKGGLSMAVRKQPDNAPEERLEADRRQLELLARQCGGGAGVARASEDGA